MVKDGEVLRDFIENQKISKKEIARGLGITRTTLYQYFDSTELAPETKRKAEAYFKKKIFIEAGSLEEPATAYDTSDAIIVPSPLKAIEEHLGQIEENMLALATRLLKGQEQILNLLSQRNGHSTQVLPGEKPLRKGSQK